MERELVNEGACLIDPTHQLWCWGNTIPYVEEDQDYLPTLVLTDQDDVFSGFMHSCSISTTGEISCWGFNYYGQLGNGTLRTSETPVEPLTYQQWYSTLD